MLEQNKTSAERIGAYPGFLCVWLGQFISVMGGQMMAFALSIWVFQKTGSATQFGQVVAAQMLPPILLAPLAGVLVDRYDRRRLMMVCELLSAFAAGALFVLFSREALDTFRICVVIGVASIFAMLHQLAYSTVIPQLVPKALYQKANGLVQLGIHFSAVIVPLVAVSLLDLLGLGALILLNSASFLVAAVSLLFPEFRAVAHPARKAGRGLKAVLMQQTTGLRYVFGNRELSALLLFMIAASFLNGFVYVLFRPMILTVANTETLGVLVTIAGVGGFAGAVFMAFFARFRDRIGALVSFSVVSGVSMAISGSSTSMYVVGLAAFCFSFAIPVALVCAQTVWQTVVPQELHGRVFSTRTLFSNLALLIAVLTSPWLADHVFEPLMAPDGSWAPKLGPLIGQGPGRGMALLFIAAGLGMLFVAFHARRSLRLRGMRAGSSVTVLGTGESVS